jgi:hypothetical protein
MLRGLRIIGSASVLTPFRAVHRAAREALARA